MPSWIRPNGIATASAAGAILSGVALNKGYFSSKPSKTHCRKKDKASSKLLFLGTGSSTGCPRPLCPLLAVAPANNDSRLREEMRRICRTSNLAMQSADPRKNKNYRNNPSLLISHVRHDDRTGEAITKNVVIDTGKTFREAALRWMPVNGIGSVDAIVLTHEHMDAASGLDDVRGFQKPDQGGATEPGAHPKARRAIPMPLYVSQHCLDQLKEQFPWLFPQQQKREKKDDGKPIVERHVASFDVNVIPDFQPFEPVPGLTLIPLPVMHGEDLVAFGFGFTIGKLHVVYLSDISRMLPETLDFILRRLPATDVLVLDALLADERTNPSHYNLPQAVELARKIRPAQTLLVGINCDSFLPHDEMNVKLRKEYTDLNIQLAHDGLVIKAS